MVAKPLDVVCKGKSGFRIFFLLNVGLAVRFMTPQNELTLNQFFPTLSSNLNTTRLV